MLEHQTCSLIGYDSCLLESLHSWISIHDSKNQVRYLNNYARKLIEAENADEFSQSGGFSRFMSERQLKRLDWFLNQDGLDVHNNSIIVRFSDVPGGKRYFLLTKINLAGVEGDKAFILAGNDITSSSKMDVEIHTAFYQLQTLFESLPVIYFVCNEHGKILHANKYFKKNISKQELAGDDEISAIFPLIENEDLDHFKTLRTGESFIISTSYLSTAGSRHYLTLECHGGTDINNNSEIHCIGNVDALKEMSMINGANNLLSAIEESRQNIALVCDSYVLKTGLCGVLNNHSIPTTLVSSEDLSPEFLKKEKIKHLIVAYTTISENEIKIIHNIVEAFEGVRILIACINISEENEMEIIRSGANGLISTERDFKMLPVALSAIANDELWYPRSVMKKVLQFYQAQPDLNKSADRDRHLTKRETEVLKQLIKGKKNREIAEHLGIGYNTIVTHVYNIFRKLNVNTRVELINYVIETKMFERN